MKKLFTTIVAMLLLHGLTFGQALDCTADVNMSVDPFSGSVTVTPSDLLVGNVPSGVEISIDQMAAAPTVTFTCNDLGTYQYTVSDPSTGNSCWGNLTISDEAPPVAVAHTQINVQLSDANDTETIFVSDVDDGSYDNCSIDTMYLSQYDFDATHVGANMVEMYVVDGSGNYNQVWTQVYVSVNNGQGISCNQMINVSLSVDGEAMITPQMLLEGSASPNAEIIIDQVNYGSSALLDCDDIGSHQFTVIDLDSGNSCNGTIEIEDKLAPIVVVETGLNIYLEDANDMETLFVADLDDGTFDNCGIDTMYLSQYDFDASHVGPNTVLVTAIDENGYSAEASTTVNVIVGNRDCILDYSDIDWPAPNLYVDVPDSDRLLLSPEYLVNTLNVPLTDADVIINVDPSCTVVGLAHNDVITFAAGGGFSILRTFAVLDWNTSNVFQFTQVITNISGIGSSICDTLPRSAPVGDCASGHTLSDDVEWPNDLLIADHRILPSQLIAHSGIDSLDARPSFYNSPSLYSATYQDLLVEITATSVTVGRKWTVVRSDNAYTWSYIQTIIVDISGLGSLVTVEDPLGNAISDVLINDTFLTNTDGEANIDVEVASLAKDNASIAGLTIADLSLIRQHILGHIVLDPLQQKVADVNSTTSNNGVTTLDYVLIERVMLGIDTEWNYGFTEKVDQVSSATNGAYTGYIPGDVDFSSYVGHTIDNVQGGVEVEDLLLNAGESYSIPVLLNLEGGALAYDLDLAVDRSLIQINGVDFPEEGNVARIYDGVNGSNSRIYATSPSEGVYEDNTVLFMMEIYCFENTTLAQALDLTSSKVQVVDLNNRLVNGEGVVDNEIPTSTLELAGPLAGISVYPNPASDFIALDLPSEVSGDWTVSLHHMSGQLIAKAYNANRIDVSDVATGLYVLTVQSGAHIIQQKVQVVK